MILKSGLEFGGKRCKWMCGVDQNVGGLGILAWDETWLELSGAKKECVPSSA